jgi:hypothetical protein
MKRLNLLIRILPSGGIKSASRFRTIRIVEEIGPSKVLDLPLQSELGMSLANKPSGDRKDFVLSKDSFRSSYSAEIVDQANPQPRIESKCPDFANQVSTSKLKLTL